MPVFTWHSQEAPLSIRAVLHRDYLHTISIQPAVRDHESIRAGVGNVLAVLCVWATREKREEEGGKGKEEETGSPKEQVLKVLRI